MTTAPANQLELARMFIENTGRSLFLTGKAGTGKTTFLRYLKQNAPKRMIVVAPTGVAAINAGGVTIHSFFQISFGPQVPNHYLADGEKQPESNNRFSREKLNIIRSIDLLVIDEISMVRADLLDAVDGILRRYRQPSKPFGGLQVLMIGDVRQLAPVISNSEQHILKKYYKGPFFFQSRVLENYPVETIELKHIFRQKDELFINILNEVRESRLSVNGMKLLQSRYIPGFKPKEGYITLTSHNYLAQTVNRQQIDALPGQPVIFNAVIDGEFPTHAYPNDDTLVLKMGAQVMFVKNDPSRDKLFFNGKIGTITGIAQRRVSVQCSDTNQPIEVTPAEWPNCKYSLNDATGEIEETTVGTFTQMPLKLAWAITIHKSQGLTFDRVIIDSSAAFAHGQVYVALSRCRTLEGIVLSSPVNPSSMVTSGPVTDFMQQSAYNTPDRQTICRYQKEYEQSLMLELFNFWDIWKNILWLERYINENSNTVFGALAENMGNVAAGFRVSITDVSIKFGLQLQELFRQADSPQGVELLQERIRKGADYFLENIKKHLAPVAVNPEYTTDNKAVKKELKKNIERIQQRYAIHTECLAACCDGFTIARYLSAKSVCNIEKAVSAVKSRPIDDVTISSVKNTELYRRLRVWRTSRAYELNMPEYMVLQTRAMIAMSDIMPVSFRELLAIKGFGKTKVETFGKELLTLISEYKTDSGINDGAVLDFTLEPDKAPKEKIPTLSLTLELYRMGLTIEEIAVKRELAVATINSHLAKCIGTGEIDVHKLVNDDKIRAITDYCNEYRPQTSSEIKNALGDNYSYDEIRMVQASISFNNREL